MDHKLSLLQKEFYNNLALKEKDLYKKMGYSGRDTHKKRIEVIFKILESGSLNNNPMLNKTIYDVGCGSGMFLKELINYGNNKYGKFSWDNFKYSGIELSQEVFNAFNAEEGYKKYVESVKCQDVIKIGNEKIHNKYDIVIANGVFLFNSLNAMTYFYDIFETIYNMSKESCVITINSHMPLYTMEKLFYPLVGDIVNYCYLYSRKVKIDSNYIDHEYCILINKDKSHKKQYFYHKAIPIELSCVAKNIFNRHYFVGVNSIEVKNGLVYGMRFRDHNDKLFVLLSPEEQLNEDNGQWGYYLFEVGENYLK